jgi:thiamine-monophosphate kinase
MEIICQRSVGKKLNRFEDDMESSGEFAFISWLRQNQTRSREGVILGPGDDCAIVKSSADFPWLITTDMLMEGSCFLMNEAGPRAVGHKTMGVNLSDIAAMAGIPKFAVVSVGLPRTMNFQEVQELYLGMKEKAEGSGVSIVGGDTNAWDGPLTISVTLFGQATERGAVRRSTAKLGDSIFVTGTLGGSILGKHLDFTPRVLEALRLHQLVDLHAMIDVSDGLALDLSRICRESGLGAILESSSIPISSAAMTTSSSGPSPLEHALFDGEDFELIFTVSESDGEKLQQLGHILDCPISRIGRIVESGLWLNYSDGVVPLEPRGYEHHFGG